MFSQMLVISGIFLNGISTLIYIIPTIKGEIQPNKVTFFLWSLAPLVAFFAQIAQGVGVQSFMTLSVGVFPLFIFAASFFNKKAYWKVRKFDLMCGVFSIIGLFLWYLTKIGNVAIVFSILADGLAALPTMVKAYQYPETESALSWLGATVGAILILLSITTWNFQTYGFPLYYAITMFFIFFFTWTNVGKKHTTTFQK